MAAVITLCANKVKTDNWLITVPGPFLQCLGEDREYLSEYKNLLVKVGTAY